MNNKINFLIGSDPELFLQRNIRKELTFYSPEGLLSGTKDDPEFIDDKKQRAILLDNVALEFLTAPTSNKKDFIDEHQFMMDYVKTAMSVYRLTVSEDSVAEFKQHFLDTDNAKEFGCSVSYNAKSGKANVMPDASVSKKRSCGGHLHVSLDDYKMTFEDCREITKIMDLYLGLPSVLLSKDIERRKMFYGKAGEFRHQRERYLEYRTLDNFWLFDKKYMSWIYDQVELSLKMWKSGFKVDDYDNIERIINTYDKTGAQLIIKKYNINLCAD